MPDTSLTSKSLGSRAVCLDACLPVQVQAQASTWTEVTLQLPLDGSMLRCPLILINLNLDMLSLGCRHFQGTSCQSALAQTDSAGQMHEAMHQTAQVAVYYLGSLQTRHDRALLLHTMTVILKEQTCI